ncbi:hypothetical protein BCR42DRAFT_187872 [Absidia repens]|uniref:Xrn1 helical domain-containing protein n=1 Tax=Absidia repens TaxID=90262 RepID=A0A1X2IRG8_9FUNG|nr:hypothetical protein BCR42DRAFT_187872 [Absidia repens]
MPQFTFADLSAAPVNDPNAGMSNVDVVRNRAALRMAGNQSAANQSAAASLKAQLMNGGDDQVTSGEPSSSSRGTKRKAEDEPENGTADGDDDEDAPDNVEDTDLVAQGKAILEKVEADKKAKDDAAREREPDDAVRLWETGWKERYYTLKFGFRPEDRDEINE